jgi:hypothetical protein
MNFAQQLRYRAAQSGRNRIEQTREPYRLTIVALDDMPGCLAFVIHESRPHAWWPLLSGRVNGNNELVVINGDRATAEMLPQLLEFLLATPVMPTWSHVESLSPLA